MGYTSSPVSDILNKLRHIPAIATCCRVLAPLLMPQLSPQQEETRGEAQPDTGYDRWFVVTVITACLASVTACWYYFQQHELLLYGDAVSHLRISRSVFDSATPGLVQLGSVWLPLPHILMWPFIWNNYLWHSGLAGSFVSMICYVVASIYLFLAARRLTRSSSVSFVGTLLFILNPNVLYLQSTPLTEMVCLATLAMAGYYFLSWIQEGELKQLVFTAGGTSLATLARYDGWALFVGLLCLIPLVGWLKHQRWLHIQANLVVFSTLGGLGIGLWLLWNQIIFGDPLYFQRSVYSSQAIVANKLFTYHNLWQSVRYYTLDVEQTIGLVLFGLVVVAIIWFILRSRFTPSTLGAVIFLAPFAFYVVALYAGQDTIWLPGAVPPNAGVYMFNVRFGVQMVAPAALFIATLLQAINRGAVSRWRPVVGHVLLAGIILMQSILLTSQGIISLQEGQHNYPCSSQQIITQYLAQHYNGGRILQDVTTGPETTEAGMDFKNIIYQGSGSLWQQAVENPASIIEWVIVRPGSQDLVAQHVDVNDPHFLSQFTLVARQTDGILLYHRRGGPPLPTRSAPPPMQVVHHPCS